MTVVAEGVQERHPYRWAMLAGVWLSYFSFGLTQTALAPLVEPITRELGMSNSQMGMVLGAWQLVYIGSASICGAFLDRFGLRIGLLIAGLIIAASGVLRAFAQDFETLFLAVALFGFGGPLISVGAPKLISQWFHGDERGFAMGLYISGPSTGNITAVALTNSVMVPLVGDWRVVLLSYAAAVFVIALTWLTIASHPVNRELERQAASGPRAGQLQIFRELLAMRAVQIVLVMSVGIFFFNHSLNNWLPEILRRTGMSPSHAGYWAAVPPALGIIGALIIPRFAVPRRRFFILGMLFVLAGVATILIHSNSPVVLAAGLICQGLARSSMMPVMVLVLIEARGINMKNTGAAGGLFFSAAELGGVLGPLTLGFVSDVTGGFDAGINLLSAICLVLLCLLWLLRQESRRPVTA